MYDLHEASLLITSCLPPKRAPVVRTSHGHRWPKTHRPSIFGRLHWVPPFLIGKRVVWTTPQVTPSRHLSPEKRSSTGRIKSLFVGEAEIAT